MKKGNESKRLYEDLWLKELLDFSDQSVILQKWQPVSYLDRGQFSRIFKVVNRQTGEEGALKFVPNPLEAAECKPENSPEGAFFLSRFKFSQQEAQIMQRFHSDSNIVQYCEQPEFLKRTFTSDLGETLVQYAVLICMPLYHNYKEWLPAVCGDRDRCIQVGKDIAKALMAFEEKGVYHRDIKPGNIMMDDAGTFYLGDVGEAKLESEFTTLGFHGTRPYMAPEVRKQENERSKMRSDHRSDIYSLGIILYRLFNHQQFPFLTEEGTLTEEATHMYARSEKSGLADVLPDSERAHTLRYDGRRLPKPAEADDALSRVILRACAHDRRERYQTAAELYEALDECQRCDASAILPDRRNCLSGRTARKIAMAGLVVLILAAGLSGWLVVSNLDISQLPTTPTPAAASETVPVLTPTPVPTPSPTPTPVPTPTPTPSPTPTPVPTPTPTPSPTPTPTPKPKPKPCVITQNSTGISVQIPSIQHSDIRAVKIYRVEENGVSDCVSILDYPNDNTFVDTSVQPGKSYTYFYSLVCSCAHQYPDSHIATVRRTQYPVKPTATPQMSVRIGDTLVFGAYEQDNNKGNGKEPVEWMVLDMNRDGTEVLLLSKYVLDMQRYHKSHSNVSWAKCSVRTWLNKTFLSSCFSKTEQQAILKTHLVSNYSNTAVETTDSIFFLDVDEASGYLPTDDERQAQPTDYAIAREAVEDDGFSYWWLRDTTNRKNDANRVDPDGDFEEYGANTNAYGVGIRPALWVDLNLLTAQ